MMKCRHIIATFIFALIAVFAISFISIDTAKAETLYTLSKSYILLPKYNAHYFNESIDIRDYTFEFDTSIANQPDIEVTCIYFGEDEEENRVEQIVYTGNKLKATYNNSNGRLSLHLYKNNTLQILLGFVTQTNGVIAGELRFYYIDCKTQITWDRLANNVQLTPFNWFWEKPQSSTLYERTNYDTRYIPQYPDIVWNTMYENPLQDDDYITVENSYNRVTGTLTFTVPASLSHTQRVQIRPTTDLRVWDIADMTLQASVMHYNNTGAIEIWYDDELLSNIGTELLITDYYTQPQLDTYINIESINGSYKFVGIAFVIPPSINPQTITLRLGQGMYMKGYLQAKGDIEDEKLLSYREGYSAGIQTAEEGDWVHLMMALWDVPMAYINGLFDITILGINLKELFKAIVLIALTAAIIKRFI